MTKNEHIIYCVYVDSELNKEVEEWRLCKVGYGNKSRADAVKDLINKNFGCEIAKILFQWSVSNRPNRSIKEVELNVRRHMGVILDESVTKKLDLPIYTEWALTTKGLIEKVDILQLTEKHNVDIAIESLKDEVANMKKKAHLMKIEITKIVVGETKKTFGTVIKNINVSTYTLDSNDGNIAERPKENRTDEQDSADNQVGVDKEDDVDNITNDLKSKLNVNDDGDRSEDG